MLDPAGWGEDARADFAPLRVGPRPKRRRRRSPLWPFTGARCPPGPQSRGGGPQGTPRRRPRPGPNAGQAPPAPKRGLKHPPGSPPPLQHAGRPPLPRSGGQGSKKSPRPPKG
ncbi:unnamed protein product [Arctia plantaginis]|uniref:Uncharacterized protein n=1 Tax=Arctia plantaginis TaxID=874455 RepID=A0A8S1AY37_ARCPL|nr:unnamed protein product [Arctia plantaginis]